MNIFEFGEYLSANKPNRVLYSSEDQPKYSVLDTLRFYLAFDSITVSINPSVINLSYNGQCAKISRVKNISVEENDDAACKVFTVTCGDKHSKINDTSYKFVAV